MAVGVPMAGVLIDKEDADQSDEEHQVAAQGKEETDPSLREAFPRTAPLGGMTVPAFTIAIAARSLVCGRTASVSYIASMVLIVAISITVDSRRCEGRGHKDGEAGRALAP